jgi:hypothetical protein
MGGNMDRKLHKESSLTFLLNAEFGRKKTFYVKIINSRQHMF